MKDLQRSKLFMGQIQWGYNKLKQDRPEMGGLLLK